MTACAIETTTDHGDDTFHRAECAITADGSYAARLTRHGGGGDAGDAGGSSGAGSAGGESSWFPERWTLDGPEPYAVPLPGPQPEEPGTEVLPLADGRVLVHRDLGDRHLFSLLYPTGPGTGEVPLGAVPGPELGLLPPSPDGRRAYALAPADGATAVWMVAGGSRGPERLAEVPGRCSGGVWLEKSGRLLAVDQEKDGRTKAVTVDLERGEVSPLLEITEESTDRVLLADTDSGLLLIGSDAPSPGHERLGWGVLGSTLPVRFPDCLRLPDCAVTPFAVQPGQVLTPENCAVALRIDGAPGTWLGVWRPSARVVNQLPAPEGWLTGAGLFTREGVLHLPYATGTVACGLARVPAAAGDAGGTAPAADASRRTAPAGGERPDGPGTPGTPGEGSYPPGAPEPTDTPGTAPDGLPGQPPGTPGTLGTPGTSGTPEASGTSGPPEDASAGPAAPRPVPLQQAPLIDPDPAR